MDKNKHTRRFETDTDSNWINYNIDDLLYGLIQYFSTYNPDEENINRQQYITEFKLRQERKIIFDLCGFNNQKTYKRHLDKMVEDGVLETFCFDGYYDGEPVTYYAYGICQNKESKYKIIDNEFLMYLISTRNRQTIKIYFYLLRGWDWKGDNFSFTLNSIKEYLGYSKVYKTANIVITNILNSLRYEGVIDFEHYSKPIINRNGDIINIKEMRLIFLARKKEELN